MNCEYDTCNSDEDVAAVDGEVVVEEEEQMIDDDTVDHPSPIKCNAVDDDRNDVEEDSTSNDDGDDAESSPTNNNNKQVDIRDDPPVVLTNKEENDINIKEQQEHDDAILAALLANGMSTFEVALPQGVQPGQSFPVLAGGERVMVQCPVNASSGGKRARFEMIASKIAENQQRRILSTLSSSSTPVVSDDDEDDDDHDTVPTVNDMDVDDDDDDHTIETVVTYNDDDNRNPEETVMNDENTSITRDPSPMATTKDKEGEEEIPSKPYEETVAAAVPGEATTIAEGPNNQAEKDNRSAPSEKEEIQIIVEKDSTVIEMTTASRTPVAIVDEDVLRETSDYEVARRLQELETMKQEKSDERYASLIGSGLKLSVQIPNHVQPGEQFAVMAAGVPIFVTCPADARPGQYVRIKYDKFDDEYKIQKYNNYNLKNNNDSKRSSRNINRRRRISQRSNKQVVPMTPTIAEIPNNSGSSSNNTKDDKKGRDRGSWKNIVAKRFRRKKNEGNKSATDTF